MSINIYAPWVDSGFNSSQGFSYLTPFPNMLFKQGFPNKKLGKYFFWYDIAGNGSAYHSYTKQRIKYRCFKISQAGGLTAIDVTSQVCDSYFIPTIAIKIIGQFEIELINSSFNDFSDPASLVLPDYRPDPVLSYQPQGIRLY